MKTLHLSIIIIFTASLFIVNHEVFADPSTNDVAILNIQTQPSTIKVGDKFSITATLANNTPNPIYVNIDPCGEPFPAKFDNHIKVDYVKNLTCPAFLIIEQVNSSEKITKTSPSGAIFPGTLTPSKTETVTYRATTSGITNATVTFSYSLRNQTDPNQAEIARTISKSLLFTIYDNSTGSKPVNAVVLSPLKQFKSGVAANNIICRSDHQLLVHQGEKRPICVNPLSVTNLIKRGWEIPTHCDYKINFTYDLLGEVVIEKNASNQNSGKSYHPITGTVVIGFNNTVQWDNADDISSSVTSDWGLFDSGQILPDHYWRYNFECTGTYGYHSEPHPWMRGWITVLPPK